MHRAIPVSNYTLQICILLKHQDYRRLILPIALPYYLNHSDLGNEGILENC